jgi:hypothetical protein
LGLSDRYPALVDRIPALMSSARRLSRLVDQANERFDIGLMADDALISPRFASALRLLRVTREGVDGHAWYTSYEIERLDNVKCAPDISLDGLGVQGPIETVDHLEQVKRNVRGVSSMLCDMYGQTALKIVGLLRSEWLVRSAVERFNSNRARLLPVGISNRLDNPSIIVTGGRITNIAGAVSLPHPRDGGFFWEATWDCRRLEAAV